MDDKHFGYITKLKKIPRWGYPNSLPPFVVLIVIFMGEVELGNSK
jgi:hypothetical protein